MLRSVTVRRSIAWVMGGVLVVSLAAWFTTRQELPRRIRIATAVEGGQYHRLGELLADGLRERLPHHEITAEATLGSVANRERLLNGDAELALLQASAKSLYGLTVIAPLHRDVTHVIARRGQGIDRIEDLVGKRVVLGPEGSGMRTAALELLAQYEIGTGDLEGSDAYFLSLLDDTNLDAGIVTTGHLNHDLIRLLRTGLFVLLPILDAEAICVRRPFLVPVQIPRGIYGERPPIPPAPVESIATNALLVARKDVPDQLVRETLEALYAAPLRMEMPTIPGRKEASEWNETALHAEAQDFYDPYRAIGVVSAFMESLAAAKELVFALAAGLYLFWSRWNRLKAEEAKLELSTQKERLDGLLDKTVTIERAQMNETDVDALERYLDEVTEIKLEALEQLSHEDLRGDRTFLIFLTQCANLIRKIQSKIIAYG